MKFNNLFQLFFLLSLVSIITSCEKDDKIVDDRLLVNSTWKYQGINCDVYYQFYETTFIELNPCIDEEGKIKFASWTSGTYVSSSGIAFFNIDDSCDPDLIGDINEFRFTLIDDSLVRNGSSEFVFTREETLPTLNDNVDFGYWMDDGDKVSWKSVESCQPPY